jgi:MFS family permease
VSQFVGPERRALEMGKVLAYGGIGTIIGPWLAGVLAEQVSISAPFVVSGLLMIVAGGALIPLRLAKNA